eukprot:gene17621-20075_t
MRTDFYDWTPWDEIAHLAYFDETALQAVTDQGQFAKDMPKLVRLMLRGDPISGVAREHFGHLSGPALLALWRQRHEALVAALAPLDPKARLPWYGPDMSARSFATARLMETWAHGQDIWDALGRTRGASPGLRHILHLGVGTYGWTFVNRGLPVPQPAPHVDVVAPDGSHWTWGTEATLGVALEAMGAEVDTIIRRHAAHYAELPDEGYSSGYKRALCLSYLYKFYIEVAQWRGLPVPEAVRSAGQRNGPQETRGTQAYEKDPAEYPANLPYIKIGAYLQATGEAQYVHDIPLPRRGLNGAPVQSTVALGTCTYRIPGVEGPASPAQVLEVLRQRFPGVVDYVTAVDVPAAAVIGIGADEPLFAISVEPSACPHGRLPAGYDACAPLLLTGFGQSIGMVLAEDEQEAQEAAWHLQTELCLFAPDPDTPPLLDIPDTKAEREKIVFPDMVPFPTHIWQITREGSTLQWLPPADTRQPDPSEPVVAYGVPVPGLDTEVACTRVSSKQKVGSQIHFYMETQSCVAEVLGDRQLRLHPSTQSPASVQSAACSVIGLASNQVSVQVRRTGGGYGGKCNISAYASSMAAVAAWKQNRTVRLALLRQVDSAMFGHRHPVLGNYHIAVGDASNPATHGKLLGFQADYWLDGGRTYECSPIVSDCLALRSDTAYNIPNWNCAADVCRTNKTSNTPMPVGRRDVMLVVLVEQTSSE